MASNAARGARAKARSRAWLKAKGYQVADLERVHWLGASGRAVKVDQLGADLLAVGVDQIYLVQVKSGTAARSGRYPEAIRLFRATLGASLHNPALTPIVMAWPPGARAPRLLDGRTGDPVARLVDGAPFLEGDDDDQDTESP